jgi:hypothetical protein
MRLGPFYFPRLLRNVASKPYRPDSQLCLALVEESVTNAHLLGASNLLLCFLFKKA